MKRLLLLLMLFVLILVLAACGGESDTDADSAAQPQAVEVVSTDTVAPAATSKPPTATPQPSTATPEPPTTTPEETPEDDVSDLVAAQVTGLAELNSYRSYTLMETAGTDEDGKAQRSIFELRTEVVREPYARHFTMRTSELVGSAGSDPSQPDSVEFYQIGDTLYTKSDDRWISLPQESSPFADPEAGLFFDSGFLFTNLEGAKRVRPDQKINGIDSRHYTFDERSLITPLRLTAGSEVKAQGEVWIAKDGGFVTRYVLDMEFKEKGGGLLAPDLTTGTTHMESELSDVNQEIIIELPVEATSQTTLAGFDPGTFPMPPGATTTVASAEFVMMQVDLPMAEIQAFYEEELAALGWEKSEEGSFGFEGMVSMQFTKDDYILNLVASGGGADGVQVMASVE